MAAAAIDVLVVDDSPLMRRVITQLLESDPRIRVVATAADGYQAIERVEAVRPDVVTLDIEMPRMNGLEALQEIMQRAPTPVVVLSGVDEASVAVQSLELGAVEFVAKPSGTVSIDLYKVRDELVNKVKLATLVNLDRMSQAKPLPPITIPRQSAAGQPWTLAIGASTGGPRAVGRILESLPADLPAGVLIVQHMPAGFTAPFARRLDQNSALHVQEAEDGQAVEVGTVYIAPGGIHMTIAQKRKQATIRLQDTPPVNSVRPSADVLMTSVAKVGGERTIGVLLTGMGSDGAEGLARIKAAGGHTLAQDQKTCTVFGMPKAAIDRGVVDRVLPLPEIPQALTKIMQEEEAS